MMRFLFSLFLFAWSLHAAGPVRCAFDAKVVNWNYRSFKINALVNPTISLLASSVWMGGIRTIGYYPGNVVRANLFCGTSYGGTNGCGDSTAGGYYEIGAPQVPLINDVGSERDESLSVPAYWNYRETGSSGGLGAVSSAHAVTLDTGITPSTDLSLNDVHVAVYMMGSGAESGNVTPIGAVSGGANFCCLMVSAYAGANVTQIGTYVGQPAATDTNGAGFYIGTRVSNSADGVRQYHNDTATGVSTSVGAALPSIHLLIFGQNNGGAIDSSTFHLSGGYAIGKTVTAAVATNGYYQTWQQFETLLGRQK
jgi:hypothetical protein